MKRSVCSERGCNAPAEVRVPVTPPAVGLRCVCGPCARDLRLPVTAMPGRVLASAPKAPAKRPPPGVREVIENLRAEEGAEQVGLFG
jgi:hypothetical protein